MDCKKRDDRIGRRGTLAFPEIKEKRGRWSKVERK